MTETKLSVVATNASPQPLADIHDRVTEAYYGKMGEQFMRETQKRVHWICNNVHGRSVLDVGCSQGIVPILLAREGVKVVGVDTSPKAIDEATSHLASEPSHVQEKITFINADFLSHDFQKLKIETVVISEVLEHLVQPQSFIDAAAKLLPSEGRLIVTVPFGINDFIDHKHTFYLLEPFRLVTQHFEISKVAVLGKWLGIVATKKNVAKSKSVPVTLSEAQIEQLEAGFFQIERNLRDELVATHKKLIDANQVYRVATGQVTTLNQRVVQEETTRLAAVKELEQTQTQLTAIKIKLEEECSTASTLRQRVIQEEATRLASVKELQQTQAQLTELRQRVIQEEATRLVSVKELQQTQAQLTELRRRAVQEEATRLAAVKELEQTQTQLTAIKIKLEEERSTASTLRQRVIQEEATRLASVKELEKTQAKLAEMRADLSVAQTKRSDHWRNLEETRSKLGEQLKKNQYLEKDNARMKRSLSLAIGCAIVEARTLKGLIRLPAAIRQALRQHKEKKLAGKSQFTEVVNTDNKKKNEEGRLKNDSEEHVGVAHKKEDGLSNSFKSPTLFAPQRIKDIKVAIICDEFTYNSFKYEFKPVVIEPGNWREKFEQEKPHLFLCESAWSGVNSKLRPWKGQVYSSINFKNENRAELLNILEYCKKNNIKTIFWNKEDPTHYTDRVHDFVNTAMLFDYVFTTAEECVDLYRSEYGCKHVHCLPFATQPRLFNPIETGSRVDDVIFAGSWYANHKERCSDMVNIFDAILDSGLGIQIFDRYYGGSDELHFYPEKYRSTVRPNVPHENIDQVYKSSKFGLNINTVKESKTMFARRVFELMSCNTLVVSNFSKGVEKFFGDKVIFLDKSPAALKLITQDEIEEIRDHCLHLVLEKHTYYHRLKYVLDVIEHPYIDDAPTLTVVMVIEDPNLVSTAIQFYRAQTLTNSKLLLVISDVVASIDVAPIYTKYNAANINVISMQYIKKYAKNVDRIIETSHFALVDYGGQLKGDRLQRALLHTSYIDDSFIALDQGVKYTFSNQFVVNNIIGTKDRFEVVIKNHLRTVSERAYNV